MADPVKNLKNPQQAYREEQAKLAVERDKTIQKNLQSVQHVAPAAAPQEQPPSVPSRISWYEKAEHYLEDKGWDRCGVNGRGQTLWQDPQGGLGKEEKLFVKRLPGTEGEIDLFQLKVPSCEWQYDTETAYGMQKQRDKAANAVQPTKQPEMAGSV